MRAPTSLCTNHIGWPATPAACLLTTCGHPGWHRGPPVQSRSQAGLAASVTWHPCTPSAAPRAPGWGLQHRQPSATQGRPQPPSQHGCPPLRLSTQMPCSTSLSHCVGCSVCRCSSANLQRSCSTAAPWAPAAAEPAMPDSPLLQEPATRLHRLAGTPEPCCRWGRHTCFSKMRNSLASRGCFSMRARCSWPRSTC